MCVLDFIWTITVNDLFSTNTQINQLPKEQQLMLDSSPQDSSYFEWKENKLKSPEMPLSSGSSVGSENMKWTVGHLLDLLAPDEMSVQLVMQSTEIHIFRPLNRGCQISMQAHNSQNASKGKMAAWVITALIMTAKWFILPTSHCVEEALNCNK